VSDRAQAIINTDALQHNLQKVRELAPDSKVLAMVKGNAYGHGLVAIGKILNTIDGLGVACLDEAIKLREGGVHTPIVLMSGVYCLEDLKLVDLYNLQIVVHDPFQITLLESQFIQRPIKTWLKIDTGMHRLGFAPNVFKNAYQKLANNNLVKQPLTVMTHLANADDLNKKDFTLEQFERFKHATQGVQCTKSIANSAGIMSWPETIAQWNRPGIMLYGVSPVINKIGRDFDLLPVMTLKSKVIALHDLRKGDAIGYGSTYICPDDMRIAVVAIGYGDGYPRHAKNGCPVLVRKTRCPLVGRVSMDMITIDVSNCPEVAIGDSVILWGDDLPVEAVAKYADTIAYELLCSVSRRVSFAYLPLGKNNNNNIQH
jgi:alanine racemase